MSARCLTCRHWGQPDPDIDPMTVWDTPQSDSPNEPGWGWCTYISFQVGTEQASEAFTKDASDYKADLHCRADFGCVLHDPNPTEENP